MQSIGFTFRRCKLVVGGSAIALKILADEPGRDANLCKTCNLSIHGFFSKGQIQHVPQSSGNENADTPSLYYE